MKFSTTIYVEFVCDTHADAYELADEIVETMESDHRILSAEYVLVEEDTE
jgi:hypothetical protein